ncbi:MAG: hypothetical protein NDI82_00275 [Anaeromyxobacteraceae bacterium]|nr:hypothetical protein [Anaeromyxobacteraceae bacterium]
MRVAAAAGALLLMACGDGPEREARRARLEVQREHLEASLEALEVRLLDGRARVRAWQELRARHGQVSAVACQVNERHAVDMARVELEERWRAAGLEVPRLAAGRADLVGRGGGGPPVLPATRPGGATLASP